MDVNEIKRLKEVYAKRDRLKGKKYYSLFLPGNLYMIQRREQELIAALNKASISDLAAKRILEVGCGNGAVLRDLVKYGATPENCVGVDLLPDRIEAARNLSPTGMQFNCGTAEHLSFPDGSFNLVLAFTVFTSILDAGMKRQVAQEMLRVLRDDGLIVWFDYFVNNPWNPDVRGVGKREIATLFPGCSLSLGRTNLVPPPLPALWPPIPSPSVPSWKALSSLIRTTLEP